MKFLFNETNRQFVCLVFKQGLKMLTLSSVEKLIVECSHQGQDGDCGK